MGSSKKVTIGYKYYLGMHMVICHGPVDSVKEIVVGEKTAWVGNAGNNVTISIDEPDLFGGDKKEGGIVGDVDIALGGASQTPNPYLLSQLGSPLPAFKGVVSLILNQVYVAAMSPYAKAWAVKVMRGPAPGWYDAKKLIGGQGTIADPDYIPSGSANPSHIIYECLTNTEWGMGANSSSIDNISFMEAADVLYSENLGLSMIFNQQSSIQDFIQLILAHISAVLYSDRSTGKFTLSLIRESTTLEKDNALIFDESNIITLNSFERPSFSEMINEVIVKYHPQGERNDSSITVQDLSAVQIQGGIVSQSVNYQGIDNPTVASRVAIRELKNYSTPLAQIKITVNRDGWSVVPGDIIKLSWAELGIVNLVLRVFKVTYGSLSDGAIEIEGTEDIYNLPDTTYLSNEESAWVDPVNNPNPVQYWIVRDMLYYELANTLSAADFEALAPSANFLQICAANPPSSASSSYQVWLSSATAGSPDVSSYSFDNNSNYSATAVIADDLVIPAGPGVIPAEYDTKVINISSYTGPLTSVELNTYAFLNNEILKVVAVSSSAVTVRRAVLGSYPQEHFIGDRIYFAGDSYGILANELAEGDTVITRLLPQTNSGVLPIAESTQINHTFGPGPAKPYNPSRVAMQGISSSFFPISLRPLVYGCHWVSRNRTLQITDDLFSFYSSASEIDEIGTNYTINLKDANRDLTYYFARNDETIGSNNAYYYSADDLQKRIGYAYQNAQPALESTVGKLLSKDAWYSNTTAQTVSVMSMWGICYTTKIYVEFYIDSDNVQIGVCDENRNATSISNSAYLKVSTNTLTGRAEGVPGVGTITGGWGGLAIDVVNRKMWLRNTDGGWRDGDPELGTGGIDFAVVWDYDFLHISFTNVVSTTVCTVVLNQGDLQDFVHAVPSGFASHEVPFNSSAIIESGSVSALTIVDGVEMVPTSTNVKTAWCNDAITEGVRYLEFYATSLANTSSYNALGVGIIPPAFTNGTFGIGVGSGRGLGWYYDGSVYLNSPSPILAASTSRAFKQGDILGLLINANEDRVSLVRNGGVVAADINLSGLFASYRPACSVVYINSTNFSQARFIFDCHPTAALSRIMNYRTYDVYKRTSNTAVAPNDLGYPSALSVSILKNRLDVYDAQGKKTLRAFFMQNKGGTSRNAVPLTRAYFSNSTIRDAHFNATASDVLELINDPSYTILVSTTYQKYTGTTSTYNSALWQNVTASEASYDADIFEHTFDVSSYGTNYGNYYGAIEYYG